MAAPRKTERLNAAKPPDITRAAELLRAGGTVAFPTETVYGLGANALDPQAVERIFAAKQRPRWDPLIVHVADHEQVREIAHADAQAEALMASFWPGPLTLLLPRTKAIADVVTAGLRTVGVRQPAHPVARELLRQAGVPVAAPSANTFSHTSPTTAQHVLDDLDGRIDAVLDGGATEVGLESTVVMAGAESVVVYRPGAVTMAMLETVVGAGRVSMFEAAGTRTGEALISPGVGLRHYAPRARLVLVGPAGTEAALTQAAANAREQGQPFGVMLPEGWTCDEAARAFAWGPWSDAGTLAKRLFSGLRALDDAGVASILCPVPAAAGIAEAIRDRLLKAAKR